MTTMAMAWHRFCTAFLLYSRSSQKCPFNTVPTPVQSRTFFSVELAEGQHYQICYSNEQAHIHAALEHRIYDGLYQCFQFFPPSSKVTRLKHKMREKSILLILMDLAIVVWHTLPSSYCTLYSLSDRSIDLMYYI